MGMWPPSASLQALNPGERLNVGVGQSGDRAELQAGCAEELDRQLFGRAATAARDVVSVAAFDAGRPDRAGQFACLWGKCHG